MHQVREVAVVLGLKVAMLMVLAYSLVYVPIDLLVLVCIESETIHKHSLPARLIQNSMEHFPPIVFLLGGIGLAA